eukprot:jgi/Picsp_1/5590/NSC_02949-R1_sensitivity to red light reduced protein
MPEVASAWTVVQGRRRKGKKISQDRHNTGSSLQSFPMQSDEHRRAPSQKEISRCESLVLESVEEIRRSSYYARLVNSIWSTLNPEEQTDVVATVKRQDQGRGANCEARESKSIVTLNHMVMYGLGSLEQPKGVHIRYQLGLAILLARVISEGLEDCPWAYDPVSTELDKVVLEKLGFRVMDKNEQGRRVAKSPTLFFMPHCDADLTCALLDENIKAGTLSNVIILGNSIKKYAEQYALDRSRKELEIFAVLVDSKSSCENPVQDLDFPVIGAFNDLSLHTFS